MTTKEMIKVAFLAKCAEEGLTVEQTHKRVKEAKLKLASAIGQVLMAPVNLARSFGPMVLGTAALAGVGAPLVAGAVGGHALAKTTDDDTNLEETKADEILAEYQRLTDQARRHSALKSMRGQKTLAAL